MDGSPQGSGHAAAGSEVVVSAGYRPWRALAAVVVTALLLPLTACSNFFSCDKASCPSGGSGGGGGGSTSGDYAYVAYTDTNGTSYIAAFDVSSGKLTAIKTVTLPYVPVAMTVAPSNGYLYVATLPTYSSPGIYRYSIGTDGSLTAATNNPQVADTIGAMVLTADGAHLITLNSFGQSLTQYSVNTSTGALSTAGAQTVNSLSCSLTATTPVSASCALAASPNNDYVVASFGTQGDVVFPYSTANGITISGAQTIAPLTSSGDFSVAIDANDNAYIGQTSSVSVYSLGSTVGLRGTVNYTSGTVPRGVTVGPSSKFVFTANQGAGTISSFTTGTAPALQAVSGSPFTGPAHVAALGLDNTGSYLVAAGYDGSAGVALFSISTTGVLASIASAGTGTATAYPVLVAMTH